MTPYPTAAKLIMSHHNKNKKNHMANGKVTHIHQKNKFALETFRAIRATSKNEPVIKKAWFIYNYLGQSQKQEEYKETKMSKEGQTHVDKQRNHAIELNMHIVNFQAELERICYELASLNTAPLEDVSQIDIKQRHRASEQLLTAKNVCDKLRKNASTKEEDLQSAIQACNRAQIEYLQMRRAYILYEIPICSSHIRAAEDEIFRCFEKELPGIEPERLKKLADLKLVTSNGPM